MDAKQGREPEKYPGRAGKLCCRVRAWGHSSAGRARGWQPRGRGFEPPWLHWKGRLTGGLLLFHGALGRLAPELLEAVVVARVGREDVDDHVEVVHEDPARLAEAFDAAREQAVLLLHVLV